MSEKNVYHVVVTDTHMSLLCLFCRGKVLVKLTFMFL